MKELRGDELRFVYIPDRPQTLASVGARWGPECGSTAREKRPILGIESEVFLGARWKRRRLALLARWTYIRLLVAALVGGPLLDVKAKRIFTVPLSRYFLMG